MAITQLENFILTIVLRIFRGLKILHMNKVLKMNVGKEMKFKFYQKFGRRDELGVKKLRKEQYLKMLESVGKMGGVVCLELKDGEGKMKRMVVKRSGRLDLGVKERWSLMDLELMIEKGNVELKVLPLPSL